MYADEIASWFDGQGRITGPGGDGRLSLSYRPELAEAIAVLLADTSHDGRRDLSRSMKSRGPTRWSSWPRLRRR